ncbi:MAG: hypothetical protein KGQ83_07270 [Planctomycetes bacterium]|nr:hypothetical protein [Planctomycetota bacterium]MDE1889606.1 hypothetical protein [Planctomycetota bacterium]
MKLVMQMFFIGLSLQVVPLMFGNTLRGQDLSNKINMLEIVISNLVTRVESLEKRISALEKNSSGTISKPQKKDVPSKDSSKSSPTNGFEDIGNGFFVKNVRFNPFGTNILLTGEMANRSETNYRFAKFKIEIYDDRDLLVKKEEFIIPDLPKASVKAFEAMLVGIETGLINRYVIKPID